MTITRNDHTISVLFPLTSGEQECKCSHNCFSCKKFILAVKDKNVDMNCLENLDCSNGDKWEADDVTKHIQEHQVKRPPLALEGGHWDEEWFRDRTGFINP